MAETKPKKQRTAKGHEIPIPTRGEFFGGLAKVAKPPSDRKRPKKNLGK